MLITYMERKSDVAHHYTSTRVLRLDVLENKLYRLILCPGPRRTEALVNQGRNDYIPGFRNCFPGKLDQCHNAFNTLLLCHRVAIRYNLLEEVGIRDIGLEGRIIVGGGCLESLDEGLVGTDTGFPVLMCKPF